MQLTFVAAAIALAATASAGVVERRITHKCIAEKDATIRESQTFHDMTARAETHYITPL